MWWKCIQNVLPSFAKITELVSRCFWKLLYIERQQGIALNSILAKRSPFRSYLSV